MKKLIPKSGGKMYKLLCIFIALLFVTPAHAVNIAVVEGKSCNILVKTQTAEDANVSLVILVLKKRITSKQEMSVDYLAIRVNTKGLLLGGYTHFEIKPVPKNFFKDVVTYDDLKWLDGDLAPLPNRIVEKEILRQSSHCKEYFVEQLTGNAFLSERVADSLKNKIIR